MKDTLWRHFTLFLFCILFYFKSQHCPHKIFIVLLSQVARKLVILEGELERAEERAELSEW